MQFRERVRINVNKSYQSHVILWTQKIQWIGWSERLTEANDDACRHLLKSKLIQCENITKTISLLNSK